MARTIFKKIISISILITLLLTIPVYADEPDLSSELAADQAAAEAYGLRMEYMQDLIQEDAYNVRMDVYDSLSQDMTLRQAIADTAAAFLGVTPYVPAGLSLWEGTDCSGFVFLIYGVYFNIWLSRSSLDYQYSIGYHINPEERLPGDIIVYDNGAHVAIYYGNDCVVHCSSPENGTIWSYWNYRNVTAVVRVLD